MVIPLVINQRIITNETESATLSFTIDRAAPPVMVNNIRWFYSADFAPALFFSGFEYEEITNLANRTSVSTLIFSSDRLSLTIGNIVQARVEGEETDQGRYFLEATNEAGVGSSYIDVIVFGKNCQQCLYDFEVFNLHRLTNNCYSSIRSVYR